MKQFILISIFFATGLLLLQVQAQDKFSLGVSAQIQNTRLLVDLSSSHVKGAYRPASVLFMEYEFGKNLGFHTGLGYSMMTQNSDAFKNNFHYLALPLHLKIGRLREDKRVAFTSFIGVDVHYLLKAEHQNPEGSEVDLSEYAQTFQTDLSGGAGAKFRLTESLALEAMLSISYGSMVNADNAALMDINNLNFGFRINLSYKFK